MGLILFWCFHELIFCDYVWWLLFDFVSSIIIFFFRIVISNFEYPVQESGWGREFSHGVISWSRYGSYERHQNKINTSFDYVMQFSYSYFYYLKIWKFLQVQKWVWSWYFFYLWSNNGFKTGFLRIIAVFFMVKYGYYWFLTWVSISTI